MTGGTTISRGSAERVGHPFVIGLTGPIAAGKSTVAMLLQECGAEVIDADRVYRSLLRPGSALWKQIVARFGAVVIGPDREINRGALGEIVFGDAAALADLERMSHPAVVAEIRRQIAGSPADVVVIEAVKLIESGLAADVDSLWLVTADPELRVRRLAESRGMTEAEARARLAASMDVASSGTAPDVTIHNSGDMSLLARTVADAFALVGLTAASDPNEPVPYFASKEPA